MHNITLELETTYKSKPCYLEIISNKKDFHIGNFAQHLPFHYVEKDWLTSNMIKQMEKDYGI